MESVMPVLNLDELIAAASPEDYEKRRMDAKTIEVPVLSEAEILRLMTSRRRGSR